MWGRPKLVGYAVTIALGPIAADTAQGGSHILTSVIAEAGADDVMVIANEGRTDVSCWGGLVSLGASLRGIRGVIADGACRDIDEARRLQFPVYARASVPVTARGRLHQTSVGQPVKLGPVTVHPGDLLLADDTGVVVVPRQRVNDVLDAALAAVAREEAIAAEVRAGRSLPEAMLDARLAGTGTH